MKTALIISLTIFVGLAFFANIALALSFNLPAEQAGGELPNTNIGDVGGLFGILTKMLGWVYTIFFVIAAFFILFAAFTYLTAKGDPEKVKGARDQIIYAVIAIVVALLAFSIDKIVAAFLV